MSKFNFIQFSQITESDQSISLTGGWDYAYLGSIYTHDGTLETTDQELYTGEDDDGDSSYVDFDCLTVYPSQEDLENNERRIYVEASSRYATLELILEE